MHDQESRRLLSIRSFRVLLQNVYSLGGRNSIGKALEPTEGTAVLQKGGKFLIFCSQLTLTGAVMLPSERGNFQVHRVTYNKTTPIIVLTNYHSPKEKRPCLPADDLRSRRPELPPSERGQLRVHSREHVLERRQLQRT
jgi:hypothetical protein